MAHSNLVFSFTLAYLSGKMIHNKNRPALNRATSSSDCLRAIPGADTSEMACTEMIAVFDTGNNGATFNASSLDPSIEVTGLAARPKAGTLTFAPLQKALYLDAVFVASSLKNSVAIRVLPAAVAKTAWANATLSIAVSSGYPKYIVTVSLPNAKEVASVFDHGVIHHYPF